MLQTTSLTAQQSCCVTLSCTAETENCLPNTPSVCKWNTGFTDDEERVISLDITGNWVLSSIQLVLKPGGNLDCEMISIAGPACTQGSGSTNCCVQTTGPDGATVDNITCATATAVVPLGTENDVMVTIGSQIRRVRYLGFANNTPVAGTTRFYYCVDNNAGSDPAGSCNANGGGGSDCVAISHVSVLPMSCGTACVDPEITITNPAPVCSPATVDLTAPGIVTDCNGALSYWTDDQATQPLPNPAAVSVGGTYYIQCMVTGGCLDIQPVVVTINPTPDLSITDPPAVCAPATVDLTAPGILTGCTGTVSYWLDDQQNTQLSNPQAVAVSGTYYIKCTTAGPCSDIKPVEVTVSTTPDITVNDPPEVCSPATVDLTAPGVVTGCSGTLSYWLDANAQQSLDDPDAVSTGGTYYIKCTVPGGCFDIKPVNVAIRPGPAISIVDPEPVCEPATVDLTAPGVLNGCNGFVSYWLDEQQNSQLPNPAAVAVSGTYYIKCTEAGPCSDIKPVQVTINPNPSITINDPPAVCAPATVDLTAPGIVTGCSGNLSYWRDDKATQGLSEPSAVTAGGTYYIKCQLNTGCYDIKPVQVIINPLPDFTVNDPPAVCQPNTVDLTAAGVVTGCNGNVSFWTDADATQSLNNAASIKTSGIYYVKCLLDTECYAVKPVEVTIHPTPVCTIDGPDQVLNGTKATMFMGPTGIGLSYKWEISGTGEIVGSSTGQTVKVDATAAGSYIVTLTVMDANRCSSTCSSDPVKVLPVADLELTKKVNNSSPDVGDEVIFTITVINQGPNTATGVQVKDVVPNGYEAISMASDPGSGPGLITGNMITWSNMTIPFPGSQILTFKAKVKAPVLGVDYVNTAEITLSDQPDTDSTPGNGPDNKAGGGIGSIDNDQTLDLLDDDDGDDAAVLPRLELDCSILDDLILECKAGTDYKQLITNWIQANKTKLLNALSTVGGCDNPWRIEDDYDGKSVPAIVCGVNGDFLNVTLTAKDDCGREDECTLKVVLKDTRPPQLECPFPKVLECGQFTVEEDIYPWLKGAIATDDCDQNVEITHDFDPRSLKKPCFHHDDKTVIIKVTWTAKDDCGLTDKCTSEIIIRDSRDPFLGYHPADKTIDCNDPLIFDQPPIRDKCDMDLDITFVDESHPDGCCAVTRTWTATDDCDHSVTVSQTITINDTEPPVLTPVHPLLKDLKNGDELFFECGEALPFVSTDVIATDACANCQPQELEVSMIDYIVMEGCEAYGFVEKIICTWSAKDRCGNESFFNVYFIFEDNTPPVFELVPPDGTVPCGELPQFGEPLISDACSEIIDLQVVDTEEGKDCGDHKYLRTWTATDACGNVSQATQTISELAQLRLTAAIRGRVISETGQGIEEVRIQLLGAEEKESMTTSNGQFTFGNVEMYRSYSIAAAKLQDPLRGVSTFDIVLISKHILGEKLLDSPYKLIAADVNQSGGITAADIINIRQLILNHILEFPVEPSWRFIDAAFIFPDPANPWSAAFPEQYTIEELVSDMSDINFIGIKKGDVNGSAYSAQLALPESRSAGKLAFQVIDQAVNAGENYIVPIYAASDLPIEGFQFTLAYDPDALQLTRVEAGALIDLSDANVNWSQVNRGLLPMSWNGSSWPGSAAGIPLFYLHFQAQADRALSEVLNINSRALRAEAYDTELNKLEAILRFSQGPAGSGGFELHQNVPNPFVAGTTISFTLPAAQRATLTIFDVAGRVVYQREGDFAKGYNEISINKAELATAGILFYRLQTDTDHAVKKMLQLE